MESRLKMRISRMFRSSFGSCRTRSMSDVVEEAVFVPQNRSEYSELESLQVLSSPKARPSPSEKTLETFRGDRVVRVNDALPRKKVSERSSASIWGSALDGWSCPPASPISPLKPFSRCKELGFIDKTKTKTKTKTSETYIRNNKKKKKKGARVRTRSKEVFSFSSSWMDSSYGGSWWYSSDDDDDDGEDETDTLFSSRSLSSSSSGSRREKQRNRRRRTVTKRSEIGVLPPQGKVDVKDSYAVVKKSSDTYNDFRTSMVEMIVEKHIFSPSDLENLLQCFLSLNSYHHHTIIIKVFIEIWEALFSN